MMEIGLPEIQEDIDALDGDLIRNMDVDMG